MNIFGSKNDKIFSTMKPLGKKKSFKIKVVWGIPIVAQQVMNLTSIHEDTSSIPGLTQLVKEPTLP